VSQADGWEESFLLDSLPDGAVVADATGAVRMLNATAAQMLGVDAEQRSGVVGRPLGDVLRLLDKEGATWVEVSRPYEGIALRTGVPEQHWVLPDGREVLTTARLGRDERLGPVTSVAVSLRSGRGRARLDRERSDLVATVAHELRSPLTGVKGFVQAMLNRWDKLSDDQKRLMLTTVNADADRLSRLITELLDVARIDTGRLSLYPRPSNVVTLTERVLESARMSTSRPLESSYAEGLPDIVVDPDKFTQVMTNLVENALRHGAGTVRVQASAPAPHEVAITVDDDGEGIPTEIRRRVFTKFWKHGERGGSGLGMYIVGGLVRAHGGTVHIAESPTGGARLRVTWPAAHEADD